MSKHIWLRSLVLFVALHLCAFSLFAQSYDIGTAYVKIDAAFSHKSTAELTEVLKAYTRTKDYYLCEAYILKKTRQFIIQDKLDFARAAALTVIDNNIDNFDAIDLYSYIDQALLAKESARQAEENRKKLEAERKAAANAQTKQRIESNDTYQVVRTAEGKSIYINEKQVSYSQVKWTVKLGIADILIQKATEPDYTSIKYGLAAGLDILSATDEFVLGADLFTDIQLLTMGSGEEEMMISGRFVPQLAYSPLNKHLFLRMGVAAHALSNKNRDISGSVDTFITPIIGLGFHNLFASETNFALHYDYCLGHFAYEDVKSAMEIGATVLLPLSVNERTKIGIELGIQDLLFVKDSGIDNRAKAIFAIGVGNVNK